MKVWNFFVVNFVVILLYFVFTLFSDFVVFVVKYKIKLREVREAKLPKIDANFAKSIVVKDGDLKKMNEEIKESLTQEVEKRVRL